MCRQNRGKHSGLRPRVILRVSLTETMTVTDAMQRAELILPVVLRLMGNWTRAGRPSSQSAASGTVRLDLSHSLAAAAHRERWADRASVSKQ